MKPTYANIKFTEGIYAAGIYHILLAPREWLLDAVEIDFNTGKVLQNILLQPGFSFITLTMVPDTIECEEKPKSNRGGDFYEVKISGLINNLTPDLVIVLETLRNHELIAILKDKQQRLKIVGNEEAALVFRYANKEDSGKQGGLQTITIDLTMDAEKISPFYEPT